MDGEGNGENSAYRKPSPTNGEDYLHDVGESAGTGYPHMTQASVDVAGNEIDLSTSDMAAEEQWQAQYLQTATLKARSHIGSMDLWDWSIVEQEKKLGKKKVNKIFRLIGRLAPNATQVHPSLRGSGGLIRTTPIREADHEFVKVSSGSIETFSMMYSSGAIVLYSFYHTEVLILAHIRLFDKTVFHVVS